MLLDLNFVSEYKKKLYSFQEDAEQLEGFQTQEMAKIKHLVSFIYFFSLKAYLYRLYFLLNTLLCLILYILLYLFYLF